MLKMRRKFFSLERHAPTAKRKQKKSSKGVRWRLVAFCLSY